MRRDYTQQFQLAQTIKYCQLAHGVLSLGILLSPRHLQFAWKGLFIPASEYHQAQGHLASLLRGGFSRTLWMAFVWDGLGHCSTEEEEKSPKTEVKNSLRTEPASGQPLGITDGNIFAKIIFSANFKCVFPHQSQFVRLQF